MSAREVCTIDRRRLLWLPRTPSPVESVVASSLSHLVASSLTPAFQGTSNHRRFERHLRAMDIDEINPEIYANARPEGWTSLAQLMHREHQQPIQSGGATTTKRR